MKLRERVRALEQELAAEEPWRLVFVANGADREAAVERYRETTGYQGMVVCMDEADARL